MCHGHARDLLVGNFDLDRMLAGLVKLVLTVGVNFVFDQLLSVMMLVLGEGAADKSHNADQGEGASEIANPNHGCCSRCESRAG